MTIATPRNLFLVFLFITLSACSSLPSLNLPVTGEAKLFAEGLDTYITTGDPITLEQLPLLYPQGAWRIRAETVLDMVEKQSEYKSLLKAQDLEIYNCVNYKEMTSEQECLLKNSQLNQCIEEKKALLQDNKMLETTLNQLKEVLIDTELKAK